MNAKRALEIAVSEWSVAGFPVRTSLMPCGSADGESQRDSGSKPRVARHELPWETLAEATNPNGVAARRKSKRDTTPLGLGTPRSATQGSSFLATLGWRAQSLWDCGVLIVTRTPLDESTVRCVRILSGLEDLKFT